MKDILPQKQCQNCGDVLCKTAHNAKYCSKKCKEKFYAEHFPEKNKEKYKRSYIKHRDDRQKQCREWRKSHPNYNRDRYKNNVKLRLWNYKDRSSKRKIEWKISDSYAIELMLSNCYYCGEEGLGIDRIDSKIGYVKGNVVPCCKECNTMKMDTDVNTFLRKVIKIYGRFPDGFR